MYFYGVGVGVCVCGWGGQIIPTRIVNISLFFVLHDKNWIKHFYNLKMQKDFERNV